MNRIHGAAVLYAGFSSPGAAAAANVDAQMRGLGLTKDANGVWRSPADILNESERARRAALAVTSGPGGPGLVNDIYSPVVVTPTTAAEPPAFSAVIYDQPGTAPSDDTAAFDLVSERNDDATDPSTNVSGSSQGPRNPRKKSGGKKRRKKAVKKAGAKKAGRSKKAKAKVRPKVKAGKPSKRASGKAAGRKKAKAKTK